MAHTVDNAQTSLNISATLADDWQGDERQHLD